MAADLLVRDDAVRPGEGSAKDRHRFEQVLAEWANKTAIDPRSNVLIVGGSYRDANILYRVGFRRITLSNIEPLADAEKNPMPDAELVLLHADLDQLAMADDTYDLVLAHEVLHHCRSPHRALLEMLRVSRRHVILMEPNDSFAMRALVRLRLSFPYELPAVIANNYSKGGVQNTSIPNYIYRWDRRNLFQAAAACMPESEFSLHVRQYWDLNIDKAEFARRSETRLGSFAKIFGPGGLLLGLRVFESTVNHLPWLRRQGNKFFACITKQGILKPWIIRSGDRYDFNRDYTTNRQSPARRTPTAMKSRDLHVV